MALKLHKNYRIITSADHRNFTLQQWIKGINRRTGKRGEGRWSDLGYYGDLVGAVDRYTQERLASKVSNEKTLIEPRQIIEECHQMKKELQDMFNVPVADIVGELEPEDVKGDD